MPRIDLKYCCAPGCTFPSSIARRKPSRVRYARTLPPAIIPSPLRETGQVCDSCNQRWTRVSAEK
jgi:hypothetical protein